MKNKTNLFKDLSLIFGSLILCTTATVHAQSWTEDLDGDLKPYEYRIVDPQGAVTRAPCPYTCADREIPQEHCKEWRSITHSVDGECYVQDLRISKDDAMPNNTQEEAKKTTDNYRH